MPVFAVFEQTSFFGACPNVSRTPPSSPGAGVLGGGSQLRKDCCCHDTSFGGVFDLPPLSDDTEAFPKASVQARLDAFLASKGAARKGCHATEMAGGGFAWITDSDAVSFISDGRLSLALQGTATGLEGEDDDKDDALSGAERAAWSILGYYYEHAESDLDVLKSEMVAGLSSLSGVWAFVLHDRKRHRVVAAASKDGNVGLTWGETSKNTLMFSTTPDSAIDETDPSAFPAGCVFISSVADKLYDVTVNRACPGGDLRLIKTYAAGALRNTPSFSDLYGSATNLSALNEV